MSQLLFGILMFGVAVVTDWIWAHYTIATSNRMAGMAGFWAAMIVLAGLMSLNAYLISYWYVIPITLGSFVGTYFTVKKKD